MREVIETFEDREPGRIAVDYCGKVVIDGGEDDTVITSHSSLSIPISGSGLPCPALVP